MTDRTSRPSLTLRRFGILFGLGSIGIVALIATVLVLDPAYADQAEQLGMPLELLALGAGIQTVPLLAVSVAVGLYVAPRLGFRSHLLDRVSGGADLWPRLRSELGPALGGGLAVGGLLVIAEPAAPATLSEPPAMTADALLRSLPLRLLYGGITEELLLRWGVLSLVAFLLWRALGRGTGRPSAGIAWASIVVAAVLFGVLHLPAAVPIYGALTADLIAYIVGLNTIAGVVFGWLYWRQSLEAAMIAHGFAHVVAVASWLAVSLV